MKLVSIKYFLKEGFKNIWINGMMSIASILVMVCCMILTGSAVLMSVNVRSTLKTIEGKNSITVYLNKDVSHAQAAKIEEKIKAIPNVSHCEYYSREEAVKKYEEMLGSLFDILQGDENPFPNAFHVTMEDFSTYAYENTVDSLKAIDGVGSISDRSETAKKLTSLNSLLTSAGFWIVISLGAVSLFIISNTIKVSMYSRRFEISIMKSIGATNWFIRVPFIIEGVVIGLISAVISTGLLKLVYDEAMIIINKIVPFRGMPFEDVALPIFLGFTVVGVLLGAVGGVISISRYLKKEGGDVVAW